MKFRVCKYFPNFMEGFDNLECIVEVKKKYIHDHIQPVDIYMRVPYMSDKIGKLECKFNTFTQTLVLHIQDDTKYPFAWIELIEL